MFLSKPFSPFAQILSRVVLLGRSDKTTSPADTVDKKPIYPTKGRVHLIGCGPGAADLLTVRADQLIRNAQVVIYDRLVSKEIIDLIPANAERHYVGKSPGNHSVLQAKIGELMVAEAYRGKNVLRLKGGDPAIFARMAEEIDALNSAGINWQIVPGITAASGCAAAAGIPLTDRASAHQVRFITATHHVDHLRHDWASLARRDQTLVFYMGLEALPFISARLQKHGLPADWPILLIENGTRDDQRNLLATLDTVVEKTQQARFKTPSLIIVGEVTRSAKQQAIALARAQEVA
ncbi:uroporphyrinogen-III C-methyltransferase [Marinobacterium lutimaris]|uniref:uroporphyrinogen-III C-methyltransferase n=1 Tax=Marinobacterium lutimaris TaxID=568106 RepID=A0A1H6CVH4_9GAMM|nr:uroporphyrinogen-III C-methyltransferase [Marinobacterium lutimaris]SEG76797.1 uroporphyrin-III C-methyltransferase [Marinobacterium lutimaris]